jgi:hypothetical protein
VTGLVLDDYSACGRPVVDEDNLEAEVHGPVVVESAEGGGVDL